MTAELLPLAALSESLPSSLIHFGALLEGAVIGTILLFLLGIGGAVFFFLTITGFKKVEQGKAIVRTGFGIPKVSFGGMYVAPWNKMEIMDVSVKRLEIKRTGYGGLICKDNMRADIEVAFFVRVNNTPEDVLRVAQAIGCERASDLNSLQTLFDAKFSEALKTVGRRFEFVELYDAREQFKAEIIKVIGTDLNGYALEDVAIDYLEQTDITQLKAENILDSEGIKKITELTSKQKVLANYLDREREKTIAKQNVEAREAILELERQQAEAEQKQKREIASVTAREEAEAARIQSEEKQKSELARIGMEEEVAVAEENRLRTIIVAAKNKERTDAVETERVEKDRALEATERERIVTLAQIAKERVVEEEKKTIQGVIRDRVALEKEVVAEQERIKDTTAFAGADREQKVRVVAAETAAQEALVKDIKAAEASKKAAEMLADQEMYTKVKAAEAARKAAELHAQETLVEADAEAQAAQKQADAKKLLAEATIAESAAVGLGEANVLSAKAEAFQKQGAAEAEVLNLKAGAEAAGIKEKADAMKLFDAVGKEHEEFKLRLARDTQVELAQIAIQKDIAAQQAVVLGEALKHAKIDIVGGDGQFFEQILGAIRQGKAVDRLVGNSSTLSDIKNTFFAEGGDPDQFRDNLKEFVSSFGLKSEDIKNVTVAALLTQLMTAGETDGQRSLAGKLLEGAKKLGLDTKHATQFLK